MSASKVYFCPVISPDNLMKVYEALGRKAEGNNVCAKLSTGEAGNPNHLSVDLIKPLIHQTEATIVECNTAYEGRRNNTSDHMQTAKEHGFTAIAEVDIMDQQREMTLPVRNGKHLKECFIGANWANYDFTMVLTHFKGHPMAGFGGALKNVAIGMSSNCGKTWIHSGGKLHAPLLDFSMLAEQDAFLECMAETCEAVFDRAGDKILFISVMNNLSVDCDCVNHPHKAKITDIGILASLDPVALDRACVDLVKNCPEAGKQDLLDQFKRQHAEHILDYAEQLGLGSQQYELINVEPIPLPTD